MTIEEKAKRYEEAIERAKELLDHGLKDTRDKRVVLSFFPELRESEDEKVRKELIEFVKGWKEKAKGFCPEVPLWTSDEEECDRYLSWFEKQADHANFLNKIQIGDKVTRNEFGELVNLSQLKRVAKPNEKQGCKESVDKEYTFKSIPRLLDMIEPTDRAKSYCKKLIDSLLQEGYATDAKIVSDCLKQMNGEKVAMATMDEQKPADKVEQKFHEGEWVACEELNPAKIINIVDDKYEVEFIDGNKGFPHIDYIDRNFHLYTIQDAKDGDVLVNGSNIFIFHFINGTRLMGYCHVNTNDGRFYDDLGKNECFCLIDAVVNPATKFQRNILFTRMREAGYEWDAEKKELKKIKNQDEMSKNCPTSVQDNVHKSPININEMVAKYSKTKDGCFGLPINCQIRAYRQGLEDGINSHKSAWSEEDETGLGDALWAIKQARTIAKDENDMGNLWYAENWLNSIKNRIQPQIQSKQEWTEEDISNIQYIDSILFYDKDLPEETCMRLRNWLQSLKPNKDMVEALRTEYEKGRADTIAEMKSSWGEEDEVKINRIVACLENLNVADNDILLKDVDWLKSFKDRVFPQPKPIWSEEDEARLMKVIWYVDNPAPLVLKDTMLIEWLKQLKQRIGG